MYAIIMAGGSGTRFWPASREYLPKQFLRITGEQTMLEETIGRLGQLVSGDRVRVVVGRRHAEVTRRLVAGTSAGVLVEPVGRNTAACIGLAALHLRRLEPGALMIVLPADHYIANQEAFVGTLRQAAEEARGGAIVTLGIAPTRPETGYGYIEVATGSGEASCLRVERFVEKPDYETALGYLKSRRFLWNSGIFLFTAEAILAEIDAHLPELAQGLAEIDRAIDGEAYEEVLERVYGQLPSVSIDYGIIEKTSRSLLVFRADFGWSDVGSWQALHELKRSECDAAGNLLPANALAEESRDNLVYSQSGRRVALLGVEGLVVVDTDDVLLVAGLDRSQDVRRFAGREWPARPEPARPENEK